MYNMIPPTAGGAVAVGVLAHTGSDLVLPGVLAVVFLVGGFVALRAAKLRQRRTGESS